MYEIGKDTQPAEGGEVREGASAPNRWRRRGALGLGPVSELRLAVGTSDGPHSVTWRVWANNDSFYVVGR